MRHFTSVHDVPNLPDFLQQAQAIKRDPFAHSDLGKNKTLCCLFLNPSLRTRLSTQKAAQNLGMNVIVMNLGEEGWSLELQDGAIMNGTKSEHIREAAAVIGEYADIIGVRAFARLENRDDDYNEVFLNQLIRHSGKPVISLESATRHPLQSFADYITINEYKTTQKPKVVLTWAPHPKALPQAVPNSFAEWMNASSENIDFVVTHPHGYELSEEFIQNAQVEYNQEEAFDGADFIYAKNWSSYHEYGKILSQNPEWMITLDKLKRTNNAKFMHCLPVRRNVIVEDAVLDSKHSVVIQEAGNRVFSAQTVLKNIIENL